MCALYALSIFNSFSVLWTTYQYGLFPLRMIRQHIMKILTSIIGFVFTIVASYSIYTLLSFQCLIDIPAKTCTSSFPTSSILSVQNGMANSLVWGLMVRAQWWELWKVLLQGWKMMHSIEFIEFGGSLSIGFGGEICIQGTNGWRI